MQSIQIEIPEEIVLSLKIPKERAKAQLTEELALQLYREGFLSFGKARALAWGEHDLHQKEAEERLHHGNQVQSTSGAFLRG